MASPKVLTGQRLTLFDLDHTLLAGDSDELWCEFLMARGVLPRAGFEPRNREMARGFRNATVSAQEFADFYVGTLAGRTPLQWETLREEFLVSEIVPRIPEAAVQLVESHVDAGDLVVMTTATNRFITELTAMYFGVEHLLATEVELAEGRFTGRTRGVLNIREGKLERLKSWLRQRRHELSAFRSTLYSDSINDLPLLEAVTHPVAVDPDPQLAAIAHERQWAVMHLNTTGPGSLSGR